MLLYYFKMLIRASLNRKNKLYQVYTLKYWTFLMILFARLKIKSFTIMKLQLMEINLDLI